MQFNSFLFILCFLPLVLLGYFTLGRVHPAVSYTHLTLPMTPYV